MIGWWLKKMKDVYLLKYIAEKVQVEDIKLSKKRREILVNAFSIVMNNNEVDDFASHSGENILSWSLIESENVNQRVTAEEVPISKLLLLFKPRNIWR